ncbi:MAG: cytochrome c oxidase cbb3-type subunit 3 [Bradymonadia bacterium]|jgi:cytochrome c oxidase cbb3-type subunit 3
MANAQYKPDQLRGHAEEADGIEEYDNNLPAWWVGLFYFTIIWGVFVFVDWHVLTPTSLAANYDAEVAAAPQPVDLTTIAIVVNDQTIAAGAAIFATNCVACHEADASGGIGPSLIDDEWIHGSSQEELRAVVANGVLDKGMPAWLPVIGSDGLANVVAFVATLGGPDA